jgi:glycine cleavage system T protein (aminomethyltransferase)
MTAARTPLFDWHAAHGARLVEFAGYSMPVIYTGIVEEHQTVRQAAGLFDVSHMGRVSLGGAQALDLIQKVWTNNAATMKDGQVRYGLITNEQGGVRDDVTVYRWPYGWTMVVNASNRPKIVAWLNEQKAGLDVQVMDQTDTTCMVALQGPKAVALCKDLANVDPASLTNYHAAATRCMGQQCVISRTGYTGEDGVEIMMGAAHATALWEELIKRGAKPCGLGARDTLRLEAAMPLYGHELTEETDPFQARLAWAVKLDKGDFVGRTALLKLKDDPTRQRRVGLELEGKRIAREGAAVLQQGREIGKVCSGTLSPTLDKVIAMAYVEPAATALGTAVDVDVRGKTSPARVVPLPFYKRSKTN